MHVLASERGRIAQAPPPTPPAAADGRWPPGTPPHCRTLQPKEASAWCMNIETSLCAQKSMTLRQGRRPKYALPCSVFKRCRPGRDVKSQECSASDGRRAVRPEWQHRQNSPPVYSHSRGACARVKLERFAERAAIPVFHGLTLRQAPAKQVAQVLTQLRHQRASGAISTCKHLCNGWGVKHFKLGRTGALVLGQLHCLPSLQQIGKREPWLHACGTKAL